MRTAIIAVSALLLCGCETPKHIVTGQVRPAILVDAVKVYPTMPEKAEVIGIVTMNTDTSQSAIDKGVQDLKKEAAKLGANGIVINTPTDASMLIAVGFVPMSVPYKQLSAQAIYVPSASGN